MQQFIPLMEKALMQCVMGNRSNGMSEMGKIRLGFYAVSGLLATASMVLIIYGAHIFFLTNFYEETAFILTGLVCLLFSILVMSLLAGFYYLKLRKYKKLQSNITTSIQGVIDTLGQEAKTPIRENPKAALAIAGLAGYLLGERL